MNSDLHPHLTPDETSALLVAAHATTSEAEREHLEHEVAEEYIPLADALAHRLSGRGVGVDDLVGVARLALVHAMRRFEPTAGSFGPFAKATISGELKKHFRDRAWMIRPPRRVSEAQADITRCRAEREAAGLSATDADVADQLNLDVQLVKEASQAVGLFRATSLDAPLQDGDRSPITFIADPDDPFSAVDDVDEMSRYAQGLDGRERWLLHLRFVDQLTQREIGTILGLSQMQISRLLVKVLDKLRAAARAGSVAA